jgi:hypothetical protein
VAWFVVRAVVVPVFTTAVLINITFGDTTSRDSGSDPAAPGPTPIPSVTAPTIPGMSDMPGMVGTGGQDSTPLPAGWVAVGLALLASAVTAVIAAERRRRHPESPAGFRSEPSTG